MNEDKEYFMKYGFGGKFIVVWFIQFKSLSLFLLIPVWYFTKINAIDNANTNDFIRQLKEELPKPESIQQYDQNNCILNRLHTAPAEFEKDDDSNHHIDFIAACANLRAQK